MKQSMRAVTPKASEEDINLTPMLDVVFILLIFFVVRASFIAESGIGADRSQETTEPSPEPGGILVEILPGDEIRINGRIVDFRAVRANLEQLHAVNPEHKLLVQTAATSTTQALVSVLDAAELAEIASVSVGPL